MTGYHVYYGKSQPLTVYMTVSGAANTNYEFQALASGTWMFAVTALAADNTESPQSPIGTKVIP